MAGEYTTARAAGNLLLDCAGLKAADSLLIIQEAPELGWYDAAVADTIAATARELGIITRIVTVGAPRNRRDVRVTEAMLQSDCTLFLARLGDQDRFAEAPPGKRMVMCYLRDLDMLASGFAGVAYDATRAIKKTLDGLIARASRVDIRCPLGTDCGFDQRPGEFAGLSDVGLRRFPLGVVTPVDASRLSGRVALADYLTPTGSRVYEPASLALGNTLIAKVESGRIAGFEGDAAGVCGVERHYRRVARQFDIDAGIVHSWHAGLHPGLDYRQSAAQDPDRWSNTVFNHPRILHFHTCGDYAPGEICWIVKDPTVTLDGVPLWNRGVLQVNEFAALRRCLRQWPELERLYAQGAGQIGI